MKLSRFVTACLPVLFFFAGTGGAHAAGLPSHMYLKTDFYVWDANLSNADIFTDYQKSYFRGLPIQVAGPDIPIVAPYLTQESTQGIDIVKLSGYLQAKYGDAIARDREDVTIDKDKDGHVVFTGHGLAGRKLDADRAALMVKTAIEQKLEFVTLPLIMDPPKVTVLNDDLKKMGVVEEVSSGETDFRSSPPGRLVNIAVGLSKFNGHVVEQGEEFVFGDVLGPVEGYTGFKKELVIKGDRTIPEYGGGLCQVSTTSYRAALQAGFPVTERTNHSYAVSYYLPIGLDATVYPPTVNLKWVNDSPGAIVMQTFTLGHKAFYNYYGTKDKRKVYMVGPYYSAKTGAPPDRIEYTDKLQPGEKKVLGHAVPGVTSNWFRQVVYEDTEKKPYFEHIFSKYQARPNFFQIGTDKPFNLASADTGGSSTAVPGDLGD